jgi:hypothetical protein
MSFIIDPIVDVVTDVIDIIVDVVSAVVDLVVNVIDAVIDLAAGILGFNSDDQDIEQFQVLNQPLFDDPDRSALAEIILNSIRNEEDIAANILYAEVFQNGKKKLRDFVNFIENDNYFEDFPTVQAHVVVIDYDELDDVLTTLYSTPITIDVAKLGTLFVPNWIKYHLQVNHTSLFNTNNTEHFEDYDSITNVLTESEQYGVLEEIDYFYIDISIYDAVYQSSNDRYKLYRSATRIQKTHTVIDEQITDPPTNTHYVLTIRSGITMVSEDSNRSYASNAHELNLLGTDSTTVEVTSFTIPPKPTGLHYVASFHKDSAPTIPLLFVYKVGDGTYTDLDEPNQDFGGEGSGALDILPAIPLRINNTNFNATATTKSGQITTLTDKIGLNAPDLISSVMEDVAAAGISDYENKVDHVFLNFGVRLWDTSQIGINYLFRFVSTLYPGQGVTQGIYDAAADDKPYNNVLVEGTDYKYVFQFAYITFIHYSLSEIDADSNSAINGIYYSDLSRFISGAPGNDDLINTYYISSGVGGYNVGYFCSTTTELNQFLAGTLTQESSYSSEAANWMQPVYRLTFTGTLKNADDSTNSDGVVKPSLVYEKINSTTLRLINKAAEETTANQEITYYQAVSNGLNAYTLKAPKCILRVVDGETGKFKMVVFNLAETNDLMIPFSHHLVKTLPTSHVTSLLMSSAHISLYVAHYEVIELPWWAKLLKIVGVLLFVMAIVTGQFGIAQFITHVIKHVVINAIIKEIIIGLIDEVSPEVALLLIAAYVYISQGKADLSVFTNLVNFLGQTANLMGDVLETYAYEKEEDLRDEQAKQDVINERKMDPLNEIYEALFQDKDGVSLDHTRSGRTVFINAMMPSQYISNSVTDFNLIGFGDFNFDMKYNQIYEPEIMIT